MNKYIKTGTDNWTVILFFIVGIVLIGLLVNEAYQLWIAPPVVVKGTVTRMWQEGTGSLLRSDTDDYVTLKLDNGQLFVVGVLPQQYGAMSVGSVCAATLNPIYRDAWAKTVQCTGATQ